MSYRYYSTVWKLCFNRLLNKAVCFHVNSSRSFVQYQYLSFVKQGTCKTYKLSLSNTKNMKYSKLVRFMEYLFPISRLINRFVTRLTRRVSIVEQELPTLPEHLSSPRVFSGVHVTRSLVLCVCL